MTTRLPKADVKIKLKLHHVELSLTHENAPRRYRLYAFLKLVIFETRMNWISTHELILLSIHLQNWKTGFLLVLQVLLFFWWNRYLLRGINTQSCRFFHLTHLTSFPDPRMRYWDFVAIFYNNNLTIAATRNQTFHVCSTAYACESHSVNSFYKWIHQEDEAW